MTVIENKKERGSLLKRCPSLHAFILLVAVAFGGTPAAGTEQKTFASPEEAVQLLVAALKADDTKALAEIFGPGGEEIAYSGDPVVDNADRERFITAYKQKNRLEEAGPSKMVLYVGNEDWPFPIPLVQEEGAWRFDANEGKEELLARRIGRNELSVIQVCLAVVDAQREYALQDHDGDGILEYAQKFASEAGKKDGLYWKAEAGDKQSPLGPLVADAQEEGYTGRHPAGKPIAYHGYYYRILKAQGADAPGGAYDYVVKGKMLGGFALVAYPAQYESSGIMTFIVNHDGVLYQKDLGEETEEIALAMTLFNPDNTWKKVEEKETEGQ
jgi:hypothetical protein